MTNDLECENLSKRFGPFTAVDDVSFEIASGSFFSILGPSGCGKTTLLRMIAGFEEPASGDIRIKGRSVLGTPPNKRNVKMVFQHLALFPMMNVGENIAYGLRCAGLEYMRLADGQIHFSLYSRLMPWDHAPGVLLHGEAGGHAREPQGARGQGHRHRRLRLGMHRRMNGSRSAAISHTRAMRRSAKSMPKISAR